MKWRVSEGAASVERHALSSRRINGHTILALVALEAHVSLPLALEVALLGGDTVGGAEQRVAAEVLVTLLHETKPRFIPDDAVSPIGTDEALIKRFFTSSSSSRKLRP